ncbi:MAG: iron-containing alcohol dehydrogenase [Chloroflexi bacterium]|nr:iron-containing alcohol dehydrogenase [Chloroflexota bacterium]
MIQETRHFHNAPLVYGWGSIAHLSQIKGQRAAIITDDVAMQEFGYLDQITSHLKAADIESRVLAQIANEPTTNDIDGAKSALIDFNPDWIVALGGGSVLDSAKALWVFCEYPRISWEEVFQFNNLPEMHKIRLAAIPSTSGTGSETSRVSVIIDSETDLKRLIFSEQIIPTLAILDPTLAQSMPPELAAASAFDALSHAIEASIAVIASEFNASIANGSIRLIFKYLPASYKEKNQHAREQLHYAATLAGMSINNSTAGLAHAMDQVGPRFGIPHGVVCAVLLPYTLAFSLEAATERLSEFGQSLGLRGENDKELAISFVRELVKLIQLVGLPHSFKDLGILEKDFTAQLEPLTEAAQNSGSARLSPRIPSIEETRGLFMQAYNGELPEVLQA